MDRQAFKQRMQNLKSYRENNPGKGYWDWKVEAFQDERTGKTTEELTHSKNPLTRKRAIFAQNAKKWKHNGRKKK